MRTRPYKNSGRQLFLIERGPFLMYNTSKKGGDYYED